MEASDDMARTPRYVSTRETGTPVPFREALLGGLAPDGGLYVPTSVPSLDPSDWTTATTFPDVAQRVLSRWLRGDVEASVLLPLLEDAFSFPVPLVPLAGSTWEAVYVCELFHGPTLSFKDFGARCMARLMAHFLKEQTQPLTILVATSGDTGSAVADGFSGLPGLRVVLLYPEGQVSPVQERQLIVDRPGVDAFAVDGTFDDCQRLVKGAFSDPELDGVLLSSANSINVGRLLPQMLYYVWAIRQGGMADVNFSVPSGNLGDLTGGVLAALGGLPVNRFLAAHNANDFFPAYLAGRADAFRPSHRTISNAMDVGAPSNFERLQWLLPDEALRRKVWGVSVSDADTLASMRRVYEEAAYVADPHTAVGLEAVRRYRKEYGDESPAVVLSTAHPAKFPEVVERALGQPPEVPERLSVFWDRPVRVRPLAPDQDALRRVLGSSW